MNPILLASKSKKPLALLKRARGISQRYGFTPIQMEKALERFIELLKQFDCGATFPITAFILGRYSRNFSRYLDQNIEFAVHGLTHVDYSQLAPKVQLTQLQQAIKIFGQAGISPTGFRSPYLSRNENLRKSLEKTGFSYVSNQPIMWDAIDPNALTSSVIGNYEHVLNFYDPWKACDRLSLPLLEDKLVEIPVSLPDDEILIDRLGGENELVKKAWLCILRQTYLQGELFTLQLHPERINICAEALEEVLAEAKALAPAVWCARLDEIAAWWKAGSGATLEITKINEKGYHFSVSGPNGINVLVREVEIDAPTIPWNGGYRTVKELQFISKGTIKPIIGISSSTSKVLSRFLQQQGYFIEVGQEPERYTFYFDQVYFDVTQEKIILDQIEESGCPLIRLGRWPNGNQSALAITGDIDALSIWDYILRMVER